jgi:hypothetical protein
MAREPAKVPARIESALVRAKRAREDAIMLEAAASAKLDSEIASAEAEGVPVLRIAEVLGTTRMTVYKALERHAERVAEL